MLRKKHELSGLCDFCGDKCLMSIKTMQIPHLSASTYNFREMSEDVLSLKLFLIYKIRLPFLCGLKSFSTQQTENSFNMAGTVQTLGGRSQCVRSEWIQFGYILMVEAQVNV